MAAIAASAWDLLQRSDVAFRVHGSAPDVMADKHRLEQVLINVMRNACDSGSDMVDVHLGHADGIAHICVEDRGVGLQGMSVHDMFEPFKSSRASGDGMGLGLSISAEIVNQHGGRIWAEENPTGGLSVHIHLPEVGGTRGAIHSKY